jgi:hypothetical protein
MTAVAMELERVLGSLTSEAARKLESRVHEEIALVKPEDTMPSLEELKRRFPEFADVIGCWADEDPGDPEELDLPAVKHW